VSLLSISIVADAVTAAIAVIFAPKPAVRFPDIRSCITTSSRCQPATAGHRDDLSPGVLGRISGVREYPRWWLWRGASRTGRTIARELAGVTDFGRF
jgi:hypothetical protein